MLVTAANRVSELPVRGPWDCQYIKYGSSWVCRVTGCVPYVGEALAVLRQDGQVTAERVKRIVQRGEGFTICSIS